MMLSRDAVATEESPRMIRVFGFLWRKRKTSRPHIA